MNCDAGGLRELENEIARRQRHIEDQEALILVLAHDGHDVSEQEATLRLDRANLALKIARQVSLLADR